MEGKVLPYLIISWKDWVPDRLVSKQIACSHTLARRPHRARPRLGTDSSGNGSVRYKELAEVCAPHLISHKQMLVDVPCFFFHVNARSL